MRYSDISQIFTDKVKEYITKGYIINTETMSGSQGEICKVDLYNRDQVVRVWMESEYKYNEGYWHGRCLKVCVGIWKYPKGTNSTLWFHDIETLEEHTYYEISNRRSRHEADRGWYLEDLAEALKIKEKQTERYYNRSRYYPKKVMTDDKSRDIASRYLRRRVGYSRLSRDKISVIINHYKDNTRSIRIRYGDHDYVLYENLEKY